MPSIGLGPADQPPCEFVSAVIFDTDGVVTDTATVHARAWKALFDEFLASLPSVAGEDHRPFTDDDYRRFVDGKPRFDGVASFLGSRGMVLPHGAPTDDENAVTICGLGNAKNRHFREALSQQGVQAFATTIALVESLRAHGAAVAVVSASENCAAVLQQAGVSSLFDVRVDGLDSIAMGLPGKPDPAIYLEAARRLGVEPEQAAIVEDAIAGVEAGRRGGFGLVIGVDRAGDGSELRRRGADVVVADLSEIELTDAGPERLADPTTESSGPRWEVGATGDWRLIYGDFAPDQETLREALCTLGNGYVATRGVAPESTADGVHYPGTYAAGVFNCLTSEVGGRAVTNESMVNLPNWLPLAIRGPGGWFDDHDAEVIAHHVELDPRRGQLVRRTTFEDRDGRRLALSQRRFVSMRDPHLAALETTILAENWTGPVVIRSALDGNVRNAGVARYRGLDDVHLDIVETNCDTDEVISLVAETNQSHIRIGLAARTRLARGTDRLDVTPSPAIDDRMVAHEFRVELEEDEAVTIEKVVAIFTSRDAGISEPGGEARELALNVRGGFDELLDRHQVSWRHTWRHCDIELGHDGELARNVHLHLFHLLQTVSNNSVGLDVGVPARGLHGEAYRGHIFWDELFIMPFLSTRFPQLARSLLLYRYRRLDRARRAAIEAGYAGAMYPWQSSSNGREQTQQLHLNPDSGRWLADVSHLQRHVNAAIAVNVWQYYQASGDMEFLRFHGAEMLLEIARFWASAATYNRSLDRFEIKGVVGPDEYHDSYPDRSTPGLDNNAYTNVMAVWCLCHALEVLDVLPPATARDVREDLSLTTAETEHWDEISRKMRVCFHEGVISQFEGYDELEEFDWNDYRRRYGDIGRLDRILEAEGDTPNRYKLAKQADVEMLFFVLSAEELSALLVRLGYPYDPGLIPRTISYYDQRTSHGSTLSRVVDAWVHARLDREQSWKGFVEALGSDINDSQHGTTAEGIHLGAMAGTLDVVQRCYSGLETREDVLRLNPVIPAELRSVAFEVRYRGHLVHLGLTTDRTVVRVGRSEAEPLPVEIDGTRYDLAPGETLDVPAAT